MVIIYDYSANFALVQSYIVSYPVLPDAPNEGQRLPYTYQKDTVLSVLNSQISVTIFVT